MEAPVTDSELLSSLGWGAAWLPVHPIHPEALTFLLSCSKHRSTKHRAAMHRALAAEHLWNGSWGGRLEGSLEHKINLQRRQLPRWAEGVTYV